MALEIAKPGRRTRTGGRGPSSATKPVDIYDVQDSNWDQIEVPLDDISPNPFNNRAMGDLDEIAADIAENGMDQPVSLMHTDKFVAHWGRDFPEKCAELTTKYTLGFGERRWRASQIAAQTTGITAIRGILRNDMVPVIRRVLIRENYHRLNPTAMERAHHIQTLVDEEGMSYTEVCDELNIKSRGTVSKLMSLLELPDTIQAAVQSGELTQTGALQIGDVDEDQAEAVVRMVVVDGMKPADAAHRARTASPLVSPGNNDGPSGQSEVPDAPSASEATSSSDKAPDTDTAELPKPELAADSGISPGPTKTARTPKTATGPDRTAADRTVAARGREQACIAWLQSDTLPTPHQMEGLVRRALLAGGKGESRSKAHIWLVRSGRAHFEINDLDAYFGTVLQSGDDDLIQRATWAIALAGNEVRAADRRRPGWDVHDAAHVAELMNATGYTPATIWETTELERLGVSPGNTLDHSDQESA